ncbi:MAG: tubulin-like doman-containing protein [Vulcanimicrobiota bacterium]
MKKEVQFPQEFLQKRRERSQEDEKQVPTLKPALMLGLGHSGLEVLVPLKMQLAQYYRHFQDYQEIFQFLNLDIPMPERPLSDLIDKSDFMSLAVENILPVIEELKKTDAQFNHWWEDEYLFSEKDLLNSADGIRQLGRLALRIHLQKVNDTLKRKVEASLAAAYRLEESQGVKARTFDVFLVSSSCGGLSSGILIDLLFLLHRLITIERHMPLRVHLFIILPNAYMDRLYTSFKQYRLLQANTYALFKELNMLALRTDLPDGAFWKHSLERIDDSDAHHFEKWRPFTRCFIIDNRADQSRLMPLEELFANLSTSLFLLLTSPHVHEALGSIGMAETAPGELRSRFFYTFSLFTLQYRSEALLKYLCNRMARDMVGQWVIYYYDEKQSASLMKSAILSFDELVRTMKSELSKQKEESGISNELVKRSQTAKGMVPIFKPLANITRISEELSSSRKYLFDAAASVFERFREQGREIVSMTVESMIKMTLSHVDEMLETEGPTLCFLMIRRFRLFIEERLRETQERIQTLAQKCQKIERDLDETLSMVMQKKELSSHTAEYFQELDDYCDCYLTLSFERLMAEAFRTLTGSKDLASTEERLSGIEGFLKEVHHILGAEIDKIAGERMKNSTVRFFPQERFDESPVVDALYRNVYNDASCIVHNSDFIAFTKDFLPLVELYKSPDEDSQKLLQNMLYHYAYKALSSNVNLPAVSVIPNFLAAGEGSFERLLTQTLNQMEPVLLMDRSGGPVRDILIWSCAIESDDSLQAMLPERFGKDSFRVWPSTDDIILLKIYNPIAISAVEAIKLSQDHYIHLIRMNKESQRKSQVIRYPIHLEKDWHRDFLDLPLLSLDKEI